MGNLFLHNFWQITSSAIKYYKTARLTVNIFIRMTIWVGKYQKNLKIRHFRNFSDIFSDLSQKRLNTCTSEPGENFRKIFFWNLSWKIIIFCAIRWNNFDFLATRKTRCPEIINDPFFDVSKRLNFNFR